MPPALRGLNLEAVVLEGCVLLFSSYQGEQGAGENNSFNDAYNMHSLQIDEVKSHMFKWNSYSSIFVDKYLYCHKTGQN